MEKLDFNALLAKLKSLKGKTVISFHSIADLDAVASAVALQKLIKNSEIRSVDCVNSQAKRTLKKLQIELKPFSEKELNNLNIWHNIIFVDVSNRELLSNLASHLHTFRGNILAIDHHTHNHEFKNAHVYIDSGKGAASEIIFEISKALKKKPDSKTSFLLAGGIVSDTAYFQSANSASLETVSRLLKIAKKELSELYSLIESHPDVSERIASIKSVQRAIYERIGEVLLASSESSAFELNCASSLVKCGADFAIVLNRKEGKISCVKSRSPAFSKLNIGELLKEVASSVSGSGGGHEFVGGANFPKQNGEKAVALSLELAKKSLNNELM